MHHFCHALSVGYHKLTTILSPKRFFLFRVATLYRVPFFLNLSVASPIEYGMYACAVVVPLRD